MNARAAAVLDTGEGFGPCQNPQDFSHPDADLESPSSDDGNGEGLPVEPPGSVADEAQFDAAYGFTLLTAHGRRATKLFRRDPDSGVITPEPYGHAKYFSIRPETFTDIEDLHAKLRTLVPEEETFVVRGKPLPGVNRSWARRLLKANGNDPATFAPCPRAWGMVDMDLRPAPEGIDPAINQDDAIRFVLSRLPPELHGVDVIIAWGSSQGVDPNKFSAHVFFLLDAPVPDEALKRWLTYWKDGSPDDGVAAHPWLDPALFNPVQAHYTAGPVLVGISDPLADRRIILVKGSRRTASLTIPPLAKQTEDSGQTDRTWNEQAAGSYPSLVSTVAAHYPRNNRHRFTLALSGFLLRRGMAADKVENLIVTAAQSVPGAARGEDVAHIQGNVRDTARMLAEGSPVTGGTTLAEFLPQTVIDDLERWVREARYRDDGLDEGDAVDDDRPAIEIVGGELPKTVDAAEAALLRDTGETIYQRAGRLVRVLREGSGSVTRAFSREAGSLVIGSVDVPFLTERLTQAASWLKKTSKGKHGRLTRVDCPERIARTLAARGRWAVPELNGTIESPTLRPDGSVLCVPGYDDQTGLLFDPGSVKFPAIDPSPSRSDGLNSLALFQDLLSGFPFADESEREAGVPPIGSDFGVAVAAILTALVRRSLRTAPMHAFRAPKMASGKSLMADVVAMIATGRACAVTTFSDDPNEERKKWLSILLEGDSVVNIDNVERPLGGSVLCSILSQQFFKDRMLGENRTASVSTSMTILATGNNLQFEGDLSTRAIPCDLDPRVERPEERVFTRDLYQYVPANRGALVAGGLTILRAYIAAGRPPQGAPRFGRFEDWDTLVRSALLWLGVGDPCAGRSRIEAQDPTRQGLVQVLTAWKEALPGRASTVAEARRRAEGGSLPADFSGVGTGDPKLLSGVADRLKEALVAVAADRSGEINSRILGKFLSKYENRIEGGLHFERGETRDGVMTWRVVADEGEGS